MKRRVESELPSLGEVFAVRTPRHEVCAGSRSATFQSVMANSDGGIARRQSVEQSLRIRYGVIAQNAGDEFVGKFICHNYNLCCRIRSHRHRRNYHRRNSHRNIDPAAYALQFLRR